MAVKAIKGMVKEGFRKLGTHINLQNLADYFNPKLEGWMNYFCKFCRSEFRRIAFHFNERLMVWAKHKYKGMSITQLWTWLHKRYNEQSNLFEHWKVFKVCQVKAV